MKNYLKIVTFFIAFMILMPLVNATQYDDSLEKLVNLNVKEDGTISWTSSRYAYGIWIQSNLENAYSTALKNAVNNAVTVVNLIDLIEQRCPDISFGCENSKEGTYKVLISESSPSPEFENVNSEFIVTYSDGKLSGEIVKPVVVEENSTVIENPIETNTTVIDNPIETNTTVIDNPVETNTTVIDIPIDTNTTIIEEPVVMELTKPEITVTKGPGATLYINWPFNSAATKYEVYRSTNKKKWTKYISTDGSSYEQLALTYGTTYYYKVKACDDTKCTDYSNIASKKVVPDKVENVTFVSAGTNNIKISWNKVSVTGYEVYMNNKKVATIKKNGTLTYNKTKLKANKNYTFKVRAYKTVKGKKKYGAFSDAVTFKTAPSKPTIKVQYKMFTVFGILPKKVSGADYYIIQRSTNKKSGYTTIGSTNDLTEGLINDQLSVGTTYYYRAKSCNFNDSCSGWSKVVSKKVLPDTPFISAIASEETKKVYIEVAAVEKGEGYEIYRSTKKNSGYKKVATLTDETYLFYTNNTSKNKKYYYKVRTYITVNGKKVYSKYSPVKSIRSK